MFSGVEIQTADLKWLVPMIVGAIALIGCVIAFVLRPNRDWTVIIIATLAVALIGASVFTKVSVTKDGVIIETAQLSAQVLDDLQKASKANSDAISQLSTKLDQLTAVTKKVADAQPLGSVHASDLNQISQDTQKIQDALKSNNLLLNDVSANAAKLKLQLNQAGKLF
jgi:formylmethanofuran dehydrogenase subunit E-like metal-binding protein